MVTEEGTKMTMPGGKQVNIETEEFIINNKYADQGVRIGVG